MPAQSRLTAPRAVAALRRSREALSAIESQLDALLGTLAVPEAHIDVHAPDRLAMAARDAVAALSSLTTLRRLVAQRS